MGNFKEFLHILKESGPIVFSILSLVVAILSLGITFLVAWFATLRKYKLVGILSGIEFKRNSSNKDGSVTDRKIFPFFIIKNIGAQSAVIEMIRLKFIFDNGKVCYACPSSKPQDNDERHFIGFTITKSESWANSFPFFIRTEDYNMLGSNKGRVFLEAKLLGRKRSKVVKTNVFSFYATKEFLLSIESYVGSKSSFVWSDTVTQKFDE